MDENKKNEQYQKIEKSDIQSLHTYESDMARAIRDNNGSLIKISLAEQKKREAENERNKNSRIHKNNFKFVLLGVLLIGAVFFGANFVIQLIKDRGVKKATVERNKTFFTIENQTLIGADFLIGKETGSKAIIATLKEKSVPNEMNVIFFKKENSIDGVSSFLSTQDFISRLQFSIPGPLVRSLSNEMLVGGYSNVDAESNPNLFLVFYTNDYDQAFRGMLDWESNLFSDMVTLLDIKIADENSYLLTKKWEDILIDNNDARILKNELNEPVLYYMFLDRNIFVITEDLPTLRETAKRLRTEKLKK